MNEMTDIANIITGNSKNLILISGPCVIESQELSIHIASHLKEITDNLSIPFVFKASYDKANRTSLHSFRGPGCDKGLSILAAVRKQVGVRVLSDIHHENEIPAAAQVLDVLQIPAFLCRQTDLVVCAAKTGKPLNIKKGQFLAPWDIKNVVEKAVSTGNPNVFVTERGTCFGYNNLVVDFRGIRIMQDMGFPVIFDATHSVQLPGGAGNASGGDRAMAPTLAKAAIAAGANGLFIETHPDPDKALCDGPNSMRLSDMKDFLQTILEIYKAVNP